MRVLVVLMQLVLSEENVLKVLDLLLELELLLLLLLLLLQHGRHYI